MLFFSRSGTSFLFGSPAPVDILARQSDALPVRKGLVCDSQGSCAAFEYLDGGLRVYAREAFEPHALSNSPYDGGGMPGKDRSLWRFVAASEGCGLTRPQPMPCAPPSKPWIASAKTRSSSWLSGVSCMNRRLERCSSGRPTRGQFESCTSAILILAVARR
jgi:hypothetical protein